MATGKNPPQQPKKEKAPTSAVHKAFDKERAQFKALLFSNPNYFGTVKDSAFQAQLNIQGNTFYEEIGCVGYQPQANRLEAVIFVKQPSGYGGGVCTNGTEEFVRFFISFDDGATWDDLGIRSFTAYDIPGTTEVKRLEYAVTLPVQLKRKFCIFRNQARVRAILSWNVPPPEDDPDFPPIWGDVHNTNIQIEPFKFFPLIDVFTALKFDMTELSSVVDLNQTVSAAKSKALTTVELQKLYKDKDVEPHRFALAEMKSLLSKSSTSALLMKPNVGKLFPDFGIDLSDIFDKLFPTDGNTNYEVLECIGLSPDENLLVGTIRVKLPNGYSGGPCTAGSKEFVTFWADTDGSGSFETCLGTTSVTVYDSDPLPEGGLEYAVMLPVNLDQYRRPCKEGARIMRIRAILSWQDPPPCGNPNFIPIWGNREETLIHIKPGTAVPPGTQVPLLSAVGDVGVLKIDNSGLIQDAHTIHTGLYCDESPFGGRITLAGKIVNGTAASRYRIMRKPHGAADSAYVPLTNEPTGIGIIVNTWSIATGLVQTNLTIHADANGYYNYEDYASDHYVESNILSVWFSTVAEDNQAFDLRLDLDVDGNPAHDLHSNVVTVLIDNTDPVAELSINVGAGAVCADFHVGDTFTGEYTASDIHFGGFSFTIRPPVPANGVLPDPPSGAFGLTPPLIPDPGHTNATYELDTTGMSPCGYSLTINVFDRTNVNSGGGHNNSEASVGFCLRVPEP